MGVCTHLFNELTLLAKIRPRPTALLIGVSLLLMLIFFPSYANALSGALYARGGEISWENRSGYVYIISNSVTVVPGQSGPARPCPSGCGVQLNSTDSGGVVEQFNASVTLAKLQAAVGVTGMTNIDVSDGSKFCITLYHNPPVTPVLQDIPKGCNGNPDAGAPPVKPPDPPVSCNLGNGNVDHGVIDSSVADGHISRSDVLLSCNNQATIRVNAPAYTPTVGLDLKGAGGLRSFMTLDGVSAEKGVVVNVNHSTYITVESVLRGAGGIAAGSYSGTVVLVATII